MESSVGTSYGGTGSGSDTPTLDQMKSQAGEKVGQAVDKAKTQVKTALSDQKEKATGTLGTVASALRSTGDQLREQDQAPIAEWTSSAADAVDRFSSMLQERDIDQIGFEIENMARRQPAMFLGGAFLLGFMAARFLKSSGDRGYRGEGDYGYQGGSYAYGRQYGSAYGGSYQSGSYRGDTFAAASQPATGAGMTAAGAGAAMGSVNELGASDTLVGSNAPQPSMGVYDRETTGTDNSLIDETEDDSTFSSTRGTRTGDVI